MPWEVLEKEVAAGLPEWRVEFSDDPKHLHYKRVDFVRDFEFRSFKDAVAFIQIAADHAKAIDHHPKLVNLSPTCPFHCPPGTPDTGSRSWTCNLPSTWSVHVREGEPEGIATELAEMMIRMTVTEGAPFRCRQGAKQRMVS